MFALEGDPSLYYLSFLGQELAGACTKTGVCPTRLKHSSLFSKLILLFINVRISRRVFLEVGPFIKSPIQFHSKNKECKTKRTKLTNIGNHLETLVGAIIVPRAIRSAVQFLRCSKKHNSYTESKVSPPHPTNEVIV